MNRCKWKVRRRFFEKEIQEWTFSRGTGDRKSGSCSFAAETFMKYFVWYCCLQ